MVIVLVVMVVLVAGLTVWGFLPDRRGVARGEPARRADPPSVAPPRRTRPVRVPHPEPRLAIRQDKRGTAALRPPEPTVGPQLVKPQGPQLPNPVATPTTGPVATVTVVVTDTTLARVDASDVTGRVFGEADFEDSRLIVVGTDNKTKIRLVLDVRSVVFDYDALLDVMTGRARDELRALLADPEGPDASRAFRDASQLLVDLRLVAYKRGGTHPVTDVVRIPSLRIDLAGLLADDKDLVTALAHHLANPKSAALREDFLDGARADIDVKDLSAYIAGFTEPGDRLRYSNTP
jgi:hypothetical protein